MKPGRKPNPNAVRNGRQVNISIPESVLFRIDALGIHYNQSRGELIREMIQTCTDKWEFDLMYPEPVEEAE